MTGLWRWSLALVVGLFLFLAPIMSHPLQAQASTRPSLRITQVDTSSFPDVYIYLSGSNLGTELGQLPFTVYEDGEERESVGEARPVALQVALVLDASGSVLDPGPSGQPRHIEVGNAARRFVAEGKLSTDTDWLASYAIGADKQVAPVSDWTRDHQAVADSLYIYAPPADPDLTTPLYDYIFFALDNLDSPDIAPNANKVIVLFSDGEAGSSALQLDDALGRATALNVPIYTVLLGEGTEAGRANMERIATLSGGRFYQLNSDEALDSMWDQILPLRTQQVIAYRSQSASPRELMVSATLPTGATVRTAAPFPAISVSPVRITIQSPTPNTVVTKQAAAFDTPLDEIEPKEMEIDAEFIWRKGERERDLTRVEYTMGTITEVRTKPPFDSPFTFPINGLDAGTYSLRVVATDELGVTTESDPIPIEVKVVRPAPPEPTVALGPLTIKRANISTLASLGALMLGLLAVVLAARNPRMREVATSTVGWVREKTVEFRRGGKKDAIKALLTVETNNGSLPPQLHISSDVTTIGRDPTLATLVLNHPQVSRLHCQLVRQADGSLRVEDSGGSTGTYVNDQAVSVDGTTLFSGDLIEIGPVHLRFYYKDDSFGSTEGAPDLMRTEAIPTPFRDPQ